MNTEDNLRKASRNYSLCAKEVSNNCRNLARPTRRVSERLIGFGIASDWVRRAAQLRPLDYRIAKMRKDSKAPAVSQMVRFSMTWSGLNALFARDEVLDLLGGHGRPSELSRFEWVLRKSRLLQATIDNYENSLRDVLGREVQSYIPGLRAGTRVTTLRLLHEKYTPPDYRARGVGQRIQRAISSNSLSHLELAAMIYAMRNWHLHGGMMSSSFNSVPGFKKFIDTVLDATSAIHLGFSKELLAELKR